MSVDIDLHYLPIVTRDKALAGIRENMQAVAIVTNTTATQSIQQYYSAHIR